MERSDRKTNTEKVNLFVYGLLKRRYSYHNLFFSRLTKEVQIAYIPGILLVDIKRNIPFLKVETFVLQGSKDIRKDLHLAKKFTPIKSKPNYRTKKPIEGELIVVKESTQNIVKLLKKLDDFEGFSGEDSEYMRVLINCYSNGYSIPAWAYVANKPKYPLQQYPLSNWSVDG